MPSSNTSSLQAVRIEVDGSVQRVSLVVGEDGTAVSAAMEQLGCILMPDVVELNFDLEMWVNGNNVPDPIRDSAAFLAALNPVATMIAQLFGLTHQPYFGIAVFCGPRGGASFGLSDVAAQAIENAALDAARALALGGAANTQR